PTGTTTGQHPPTSAMGAADSSTAASAAAAESAKPQHPPTATMNQATQGGGASPRAGEAAREQHPPTAAMNEATQGGAASPQDVQSQIRGGPTAAQQAEGARRPASDRLASAQSALEQARRFDASGQEAVSAEPCAINCSRRLSTRAFAIAGCARGHPVSHSWRSRVSNAKTSLDAREPGHVR